MQEWKYGELSIAAKCSMAASTDYDLTGQVPWPALTVIGYWLASPDGTATVKGAHCCELGAGIGVPGLLAAKLGETAAASGSERAAGAGTPAEVDGDVPVGSSVASPAAVRFAEPEPELEPEPEPEHEPEPELPPFAGTSSASSR